MPPKEKEIVYVDAMVVIEATRTNCWKALVNRYDVRTVKMVAMETQSGNRGIQDYVKVDASLFDQKVTVHEVGDLDVAKAMIKSEGLLGLDAGERDLLAFAAKQSGDWVLTTSDRAAVRVACELGLGPRLRSLEELAQACGQKPTLQNHYSKNWLSKVKTQFALEM